MSLRDRAIITLDSWFVENDENLEVSNEEDWGITEYRDAFLFNPAPGRRANLYYLVKGNMVVVFSPSLSSIDDAYSKLIVERSGSGEG